MFRQRHPRSQGNISFPLSSSQSPSVSHLPHCFHRVGSIESANNLLRLHPGRIYTLIKRSIARCSLASDCSFMSSLRGANSRDDVDFGRRRLGAFSRVRSSRALRRARASSRACVRKTRAWKHIRAALADFSVMRAVQGEQNGRHRAT